MSSYWKWTCIVEANGSQHPHQGNTQGPDHATEDKIRAAAEDSLRQTYPRGYTLVTFLATRLG